MFGLLLSKLFGLLLSELFGSKPFSFRAFRCGAGLCLSPFFGRDAMTTSIPAQLALRYDCLIVPVRVERIGGARFRVTCHPPLDVPLSGRRKADVAAVTARINAVVEDWVRDRPAQWLWPHRRWAG